MLEQHGIATVGISLIREVTEKLRPPRALSCRFPLGRPLGRPDDAVFQHRVLEAAFALLAAEQGPVLADYPETIEQDLATGLSCPLPVRADDGAHPAVGEARGLVQAYRRSLAERGRTNVGRFATADEVPDVVRRFVLIAAGTTPAVAGIASSDLMPAASDVRAYYEEAALALVGGAPAAGQSDVWFFRNTRAGAALVEAWGRLRESDGPKGDWLYVVPKAFHPPREPPAA